MTGSAGAAADSSVAPPVARRRRFWRRVARGLVVVVASLVVLALVAALAGWSLLRGSLARRDGRVTLAGLTAPVTVTRDSLGAPTIAAANRLDAARALGFVHAQERFFQMDLARRQPAGELAALVGRAALTWDRDARRDDFRRHAADAWRAAPPAERAALDAYVAGVNAGLGALRCRPFEYFLLRARPDPWRPEDSYLVLYAMYNQLNEENECGLAVLYEALPRPLADFLAPAAGPWDAPLTGEAPPAAAPPGPQVVDLRHGAPAALALAVAGAASAGIPAGSNNWAVSGARSRHGGALLADDMHLGLSVPNIWFRAVLAWPEAGQTRRQVGVTLPGVPGLVVGSNGRVAWGFTNAMADVIDLVVVEPDPADTNRYLAPGGPRPLQRRREIIAVRGAPAETLTIRDTIWGPVVRRDHQGRRLARHWTAYDPQAANFALLAMADARTVDDALALGPRCGIPPQNLTVVDADGRLAWTIIGRLPRRVGGDGRLPRRVGGDGRLPVSWADGARRWDGWLPAEAYPRVVDPPEGRLWTANNRVVDGAAQAAIGDGGFSHGARARQIRDDLRALDRADERDLLAIQLDDRALLISRWRDLLLGLLTPAATDGRPARAELCRRLEQGWDGHASVASVGYRLARAFRTNARELVLGWLTAPCTRADPTFSLDTLGRFEDPLWTLVSQRPANLLDPRFPSWDAALLAIADTTIARLTRDGRPLASRTWGERNTAAIRHPLSTALPRRLRRWLDMPRDQLPGDSNLPRVASPTLGASERLVVSPGREEQGLFEMPAGQSGHPLSPYYRRGHAAWVRGEARPLLPGVAVWTLTLRP